MSWAGLTAKLNAEKNARDAAESALAKAEAECRQLHGCGLRQYIANAEKAAVTPEAVADSRSSEGELWMDTAPLPKHPNPSIDGYHKLEEQAKAAARAGNIPLAIQRLEDANSTQEDYERKAFGNSDFAHSVSRTYRLARRNSLSLIHQNLLASDPGVAQARLEVSQILSKHGAKLIGLG